MPYNDESHDIHRFHSIYADSEMNKFLYSALFAVKEPIMQTNPQNDLDSPGANTLSQNLR